MQQHINKFWNDVINQSNEPIDLLEFLGNLHQYHTFSGTDGTILFLKHPLMLMLTGYLLATCGELHKPDDILLASKEVIEGMITEAENNAKES